MTVKLLNPPGHLEDPLYHHVSVASGTRYVPLAGQVSWNEYGELVAPSDLAEQVVQVLRNVKKGLDAAGATFADVVRITWYAADWQKDKIGAFAAGMSQASRELHIPTFPVSLIGVSILYEPGILIEAEVTAIVD